MSRYTEITDGKVTNVVLATAEVAQERGWILNTGETIGDLWDGNVFTKPEPEATQTDYEALGKNSHIARLRGQAITLSEQGDFSGAIDLLIKSLEA